MAPRGRPRSFDREQALERLMEVFWSKGYEGAQLKDLMAAINVGPPSFYGAFGSKEAAFTEAVDLYIATVGSRPMQPLQTAPTAREGIRGMLEGTIDVALSTRSGGCMLILGVVNCLPEHQPAREYLLDARRKTVALIKACLQRGIEDGNLTEGTDVNRLAAFYHGVMQAISFQARDGATRPELEALIEPAMAAFP
ncbi:MAG: TetR/AcrR family transcriptional regulator [Roseovarius sp.]|uniref:TetR/AcrR family transcriptional regulator n=1 Tax=Roseovarius sp. TaxID=1486281 RepID=UPI0032ECC164